MAMCRHVKTELYIDVLELFLDISEQSVTYINVLNVLKSIM